MYARLKKCWNTHCHCNYSTLILNWPLWHIQFDLKSSPQQPPMDIRTASVSIKNCTLGTKYFCIGYASSVSCNDLPLNFSELLSRSFTNWSVAFEQDYYSCVDPCPWYCSIVTQKRKVGTIAPKKFIARLRKEKVEFDNYMQQVNNQIYRVTRQQKKIWPSFHYYKQKCV